MNNEEQPDPDNILRAIKSEEQRESSGRLKIFFGMSAGVGKTYAMLQEAHEKMKEGVNLVVAVVNTHGRVETENLVKNLPLLPEKWVPFKDKAFKELDLEAVLKLKPDLVLIDELAHTNVPGSKHLKRWQDVVEILDAGIDVYTTLNVQHLESRKEIIEGISGIQIHETVPDLVLERASAFEIIDIPPAELLKRLKEGKVYLGDQSRIAAENFFQEDRLTALREIALRFTAEKVDHDLHGILTFGKGWKTRERLMVAISPAPSSQQLIRSARRFAFELDAPWVAVYVNVGKALSDEDHNRLNKHLQLAKELGAEVITTEDVDIASALQRIAKQKSITRLIIGRPAQSTFFQRWFCPSFIDKLEEQSKQMDILILRQDKLTHLLKSVVPIPTFTSSFLSYLSVTGVVLGITLVGSLLSPYTAHSAIGYLYLIGILILSLFVGEGPVLLAATLSALGWDYLFIPPYYSLIVKETSDLIILVTFFFAAIIAGTLNARIRVKDFFLHRREKTLAHLQAVTEEIFKSRDIQTLKINVTTKLKQLFGGEFDLLFRAGDHHLEFDHQLASLQETDKAAALWCFINGKMAGWSTDTLPSASATYFPIRCSNAVLGTLVYLPKSARSLSSSEIDFVIKVTDRLGIYLNRLAEEEEHQHQTYVSEIEKLHNAIFHSFSKGFYAPLETIFSTAKSLKDTAKDDEEKKLALTLMRSGNYLKTAVDNILTISRLESGFVQFNRQKHSIKQLIEGSIETACAIVNDHPVKREFPEADTFITCDSDLIKIALVNLLLNAINYSPPKSVVTVRVEGAGTSLKISILDEGAGIPEELIPMIFKKFYRLPGARAERIGLGLTVVKAVVDLHQGNLEVKKREAAGTEFSVALPLE